MALKVDSSFLRFVTMGALGTRRVCELMTQAGLQPIELERYSRSNKIWVTKVKRLRLPDLLCLKTGIRVEVRAKTKLAIKMSDTPTNPERRWNTGLQPRDVIAFIAVREGNSGTLRAADTAELFWVEHLTATEAQSRLGPPKSASEGAERDREWPSIVPNSSGVVHALDQGRIVTGLESGRTQTYQLRGKTAYLSVGQPFVSETQFLAGVPPVKATFPNPRALQWNPRTLLRSALAIDRYAAVKALGFIGQDSDVPQITDVAEHDPEGRVALEAAAALLRLGVERGLELLRKVIDEPPIDYLRMEAILALSELQGTRLSDKCAELLVHCATADTFVDDEVRQAAIWGLGRDGLRTYNRLLQFLDSPDDDELMHAVAAFGPDLDSVVIDSLTEVLGHGGSSQRAKASASFVLARTVPLGISAPRLLKLFDSPDQTAGNWALATLGQMSPAALRPYLSDPDLVARLEPLHLTSPECNWTRSENLVDRLTFVCKQTSI